MISCHLQSNGIVATDLDIPTQTKISNIQNNQKLTKIPAQQKRQKNI